MSYTNTVLALGFFDGVHLGHAALLRRAAQVAAARGATPMVFTFDRSPREVVTGQPCPLINSPLDRADLIRRLCGIQQIRSVPFDEAMMRTPWQDYVQDLLIGRLGAIHLVVGEDHRFGYGNEGTATLLAGLCEWLGIGCDIIPQVQLDGVTVSSTYIRRLLELGQLQRANTFLGHPHQLSQVVRHGRRIGHTIGVPTVNLTLPPHVLEPAHGVYAAQVTLPGGQTCMAVTNIGTRPTVNQGRDVTVESYLLDFDGDLYGQQIRVMFCQRLRDEIRFDSLEALKAQITADAQATRDYFAAHP